MLKIEIVLQSLDKMPKEFTVDELLERIILLSKIEKGMKDADEGRVYKHEDILNLIKRR